MVKLDINKKDLKVIIENLDIVHQNDGYGKIDECNKNCWYVSMKQELNTALNSKANKK